MNERLVKLAESDLSNARDNLARARSASLRHDPTLQWGNSGQTLNQIIAGYEEWEQEALAALDAAKGMPS